MNTFIVTDSCCDLPLSFVQSHSDHLEVIGMPVNIEGYDYFDDLGHTFTHEKLYEKLKQGIMPATAQINTYRFSQVFEKLVKANKTVIYIGFSSGMSGTYYSAYSSIELVKEKYPLADIRVIDSQSASIGQGLLTLKAIGMSKDNQHADKIVQWLETHKMSVHHWFAVDDLNFLKQGGRITYTEAVIGGLLNVKPILVVNLEGKLKAYTKVKGRKKSIRFLVDKFNEHYKDCDFDKVIIGHGHVYEDALILKNMLLDYVDEKNIVVSELSATIASHVGPGMLALSFMGKEREEK